MLLVNKEVNELPNLIISISPKNTKKEVTRTQNLNTQRKYLVLIPLVLSAVSPFRKAKDDGLSFDFAVWIMFSHCSGVAKLGK